jgi:hypothetical protein
MTATNRRGADDALAAVGLAAACEVVSSGVARSVSITIARSSESSAIASVAERIASAQGLSTRVELAPRSLTIRVVGKEEQGG